MGRYMDLNIDSDQNGSPDCSAPFVTPFRLYEELRPDTLNLVWYQANADEIIGDSLFVVGSDTTHINNIRKTSFGEGRMYLGTSCGTWLGTDALDFSMNPTWFHVSTASIPASMELAAGGDILYVGTSGGRLYRISGLLNAHLDYVDSSFDLAASGIKTTMIHNFGQYISGVTVDKNDPGHVAVAVGNYGNTNYVFRSTVADTITTSGSFVSIQGNLPRMPCYDVVIDYYNPNNIIVGTELGIYASDNLGVNWTYQGNGITATPIFGLRQEMFQDVGGNCYILYAGTHGRGFYRSTTLTAANCNVNVAVASQLTLEPSAMVYPNPARDRAWIRISMNRAKHVHLLIYDITGRAVLRNDLGVMSGGSHDLSIAVANLPSNQYLVVVDLEDERVVRKLTVL
jgi:hypothetical protein